jgi:hypothetical protein
MDHQRATPPAQQPSNHDVLLGHRLFPSISLSAMPFQHRRRVVDHHPTPTAFLLPSTHASPVQGSITGHERTPNAACADVV